VYSPAGSVPPPSHVTSCTPAKSYLYLDSSLETVIREPVLYKLLTFHNLNLISIFCCLDHLYKESVQVQVSFEIFVTNLFFTVNGFKHHIQPPSGKTTPRRLSAAAYSIYLQLPSLAGGCSSMRNLRTCHAMVTGTHLASQNHIYIYIIVKLAFFGGFENFCAQTFLVIILG
jgi:hypothetical protein